MRRAEDLDPWQGDIVDEVTFVRLDGGKAVAWSGPAMLISNTCDMQRAEFVLVAPAFSPEVLEAEGDITAIRHNKVSDKLYLPAVGDSADDLVIDLSQIQSIETEAFLAALKSGAQKRRGRLSQYGYYLFMAKLTLHLMRPETVEVERGVPGCSETPPDGASTAS